MYLVGQPKLNNFINQVTLENCPHFIIMKGPKGCGKTFVTQLLASALGISAVEFDHSVEGVRHIISTAYEIKEPHIYWCENLDKMHVSGKNSLLKVTEETPKNAYIVLHCQNTPLGTLLSRSQLFEFEPYALCDYEEYCGAKGLKLPQDYDVAVMVCNSLAEFEYQITTGKYEQTIELANKVLDYIGEVSKVNAFKIVSKLALKKDAEGLDPIFFLSCIAALYVKRLGRVKFGDIIIRETYIALNQLRQDVLSKTLIMNKWVLDIMKGIDEVC